MWACELPQSQPWITLESCLAEAAWNVGQSCKSRNWSNSGLVVIAPTAACIGLHMATDDNSSYHDSCVIRNCVVDFGQTTSAELALSYRGISAGGGRGTIVEGNQVRNCKDGGPSYDLNTTIDLIVRNNYYFKVANGIVHSLTGVGPTGSGTIRRIIIQKNVFEWPLLADLATAQGIVLNGNNGSDVFGQVIIRENVFRRYDSGASGSDDLGISLNGCAASFVENNVVQVASANNAFSHQYCGTVQVFNTRAIDGTFYPGYNLGTLLHDPELTTDVEDALLAL